MKNKNTKLSKGFTITEMIIVVSIIMILAALIIVSYIQQQHKGNDAKRKADMDRIKIAVEEYEKDHNCYPDESTMIRCGSDSSIAIHPYLNDVPCDPVTRLPYPYETDTAACHTWYRLYGDLQNEQDPVAIPSIGPANSFNYYVSSENATKPISNSSATSLPSPSGSYSSPGPLLIQYWGCIDGVCTQIGTSGSGPDCQPGYDNSNCYGQCGTIKNPANECISQ